LVSIPSAIAQAKSIEATAEAQAEADRKLGMAEAKVVEIRSAADKAQGLAEAEVIEAKGLANASSIEAKGQADANSVEAKGRADANSIEAKGAADAKSIEAKGLADAKGLEEKAKAMSKLDGPGKEHEEFKLRLAKEKEIELAEIGIQESVAEAQAMVLSEAMKSAKIDIVGGDNNFFTEMMQAVTQGKRIDKMVNNSSVLSELKDSLLGNGDGPLAQNLQALVKRSGIGSEEIRNLSLTALLLQLQQRLSDDKNSSVIQKLLSTVQQLGVGNENAMKYLN